MKPDLPGRHTDALHNTLAGFAIGLIVWMTSGVLKSSGWVSLTFIVMALVPFAYGWSRIARRSGRPAALAGLALIAAHLAGQAHIAITTLRSQPLRIITLALALLCLIWLVRHPPRLRAIGPALHHLALAGALTLTGGAYLAGQIQVANVLSTLLIPALAIFWWMDRRHSGARWRDRLTGVLLASILPVALSLATPIGHALAAPLIACVGFGLYLLWHDYLRGPN